MAKDVSNKPVSSGNNDTTSSSSISDQQKVPPLRIVLNTSGNQKSSSNAVAVTTTNQIQQSTQQQQHQESRKEKQNDAKTDSPLKSGGGKVRIKLGTNKQASNKSNNNNSSSNETSSAQHNTRLNDLDESQRAKAGKEDNKEDSSVNYSHLRRITRRSQRTVQTVSNEDEESISSMTSTDENQTTTNSASDNNNASQDTVVSTCSTQSGQTTVTSTTTTTATKTTTEVSETPRRYKRRKGETTEFQLSEHDGPFGIQNYKLPNQNSFELYKNIRKQVDKKLQNLSSIHPKTPYGFRDYMLTRGAYLLDGNKLGNGTNLFMNENGGLRSIQPITKFHALRHNRVNYSIPDRAKVPHSLPVNSPLYNLFTEQEKERHRMRMQHIKEREKLTLAAEQEIVRVHNQAAMAAANQIEPFSVCTMLKHQEIYNYMDADGVTILAAEDQQQEDQATKEIETRTRRGQPHPPQVSPTQAQRTHQPPAQQQFEQISPPASRKNSDAAENPPTCDTKSTDASDKTTASAEVAKAQEPNRDDEKESIKDPDEPSETSATKESDQIKTSVIESEKKPDEPKVERSETDTDTAVNDVETIAMDTDDTKSNSKDSVPNKSDSDTEVRPSVIVKPEPIIDDSIGASNSNDKDESNEDTDKKENIAQNQISTSTQENQIEQKPVPMDQDAGDQVTLSQETADINQVLTDDDRNAYNREVFLMQLQEIDDKWEKIRNEMLIRHRNEADSLYAVQRLEWEWKTKEIGVCDVRTTPVIDNSLVPKLNIYSQDY